MHKVSVIYSNANKTFQIVRVSDNFVLAKGSHKTSANAQAKINKLVKDNNWVVMHLVHK